MIVTKDKFNTVMDTLSNYDTWCVDVETNGLDPYEYNQICGVGVLGYGPSKTDTYYFPFRHHQGTNLDSSLLGEFITSLNRVHTLLGYNMKFDLRFLE